MPPRLNGTLEPSGAPWYERLFANQLCSVVIGVGFDEYGSNRPQDYVVESGLIARGFVRDDHRAIEKLTAAGRPPPTRKAAHYIATAAARDAGGRPVDVVVTLTLAGDGYAGGDVASAFLEGLGRCDVAMYGGHGRYGTGPDFDYNFTADLLDDKGNVEASFSEYKDLEEYLQDRGRAKKRSALAEYRDLVAKRRLVIHRINSGNLVINLRNYHTSEFGAHLMVDQLKSDPNIRRMSKQVFDRRYRLWLFHGCRTHDYFYNLRTLNPKANAGGLDLLGTRRVVYWSHIGNTLLKLLDELMQRRTFSEILHGLSSVNPENPSDGAKGPSHVADLGKRP
ncbi:MAG TPA: hypothetical protein VIK91_23740 [Nannocystis sp.]